MENRCSAEEVFRGIYWNAIDSYRGLAGLWRTNSRIVFENEEILRDALNGNLEKGIAGGPVAAISIHQGSFELLHRSLCRYSNNVHLVTDTLKDGALRRVIQEFRSHRNLTEYRPDQSRALLRNLFKKNPENPGSDLSGNGILAMVIDQGKNTKGNKVKLFGKDSTLYLKLPELVNQMGAGIVTFRTFTQPRQGKSRKSDFKGRIVIRFEKYYPPQYNELIKNRTSEDNKGSATLVKSIAKEVESWISEHPNQWSWNYHGNFRVQ